MDLEIEAPTHLPEPLCELPKPLCELPKRLSELPSEVSVPKLSNIAFGTTSGSCPNLDLESGAKTITEPVDVLIPEPIEENKTSPQRELRSRKRKIDYGPSSFEIENDIFEGQQITPLFKKPKQSKPTADKADEAINKFSSDQFSDVDKVVVIYSKACLSHVVPGSISEANQFVPTR